MIDEPMAAGVVWVENSIVQEHGGLKTYQLLFDVSELTDVAGL